MGAKIVREKLVEYYEELSEEPIVTREIHGLIKKKPYTFSMTLENKEDGLVEIVYRDMTKFNYNDLLNKESSITHNSFTHTIKDLDHFKWIDLSEEYSKIEVKGIASISDLTLTREIRENDGTHTLMDNLPSNLVKHTFLAEFLMNIYLHGSTKYPLSEVLLGDDYPILAGYHVGSDLTKFKKYLKDYKYQTIHLIFSDLSVKDAALKLVNDNKQVKYIDTREGL